MVGNSSSSDSDSNNSADGRIAKRRRRTLRSRIDRNRLVEAANEPVNGEDTPQDSSFQRSLNLGFPVPTVTETHSMAALRQHPNLFDPTLDRGSLESLQRLMMLSSANSSLAQASLPFPGLYPPINSLSALSMLAVPQQQLPFYFNSVPHSFAFRESALGLRPALSRIGPLASLTMSGYSNGLLGYPLVMQPSAAAALVPQTQVAQSNLPGRSAFALDETHDGHDEPISDVGDSTKSIDKASHSSGSVTVQKNRKRSRSATARPIDSGLLLFVVTDRGRLNENQIFLRKQIELFRATEDDILSHTRGKNKPIYLHQVGIRCRHCRHVPIGARQKGSTYFPSNLMGIYQAAQNLNVDHLQSGLCRDTPPEVREQVERLSMTKPTASGAGKKYWAEAGGSLGLVDTEEGIRFVADVGKE